MDRRVYELFLLMRLWVSNYSVPNGISLLLLFEHRAFVNYEPQDMNGVGECKLANNSRFGYVQ
jgi:hypothetical protein